MSPGEFSALGTSVDFPGKEWYEGWPLLDRRSMKVFINSSEESRARRLPLVVVDLLDQTVRVVPYSREAVVHAEPLEVYGSGGSGRSGWEWRMTTGGGHADERWLESGLLPDMLKCNAPDMDGYVRVVYYRLDAHSGDYVECTAAEWPQ